MCRFGQAVARVNPLTQPRHAQEEVMNRQHVLVAYLAGKPSSVPRWEQSPFGLGSLDLGDHVCGGISAIYRWTYLTFSVMPRTTVTVVFVLARAVTESPSQYDTTSALPSIIICSRQEFAAVGRTDCNDFSAIRGAE